MGKKHLLRQSLSILLTSVLVFTNLLTGPVIQCKSSEIAPQRSNSSGEIPLSNPTTNPDGTVLWDTIYFGKYIQYDTNNDGLVNQQDMAAPILWRVLFTNEDASDVTLMTEQVIVFSPYMKDAQNCTWETSTIRSWLNGYDASANIAQVDYSSDNFVDTAFSKEQQAALLPTNVHTEPLEENLSVLGANIQGGNDTTDKVYLPSWEEITNSTYGFSASSSYDQGRVAGKAKRYLSDPYVPDAQGIGNTSYALRNPGADNAWNAFCGPFGGLYAYGDPCNHIQGIRPMIHVNLKDAKDANGDFLWNMASKVTSALETITEVSKSVPSQPTYCDGCSSYDVVTFGSYYQKDTNQDGIVDTQDEKLPIRWRVLSQYIGDNLVTYRLISEDILDFKPFHSTNQTVTWEDSSLRQWLNEDFFQTAFNASEQRAISSTFVYNYDYALISGTATQKELFSATSDKVSLLDLCDDANNPAFGFRSTYAAHNDWIYSYSRCSKPTDYALAQNKDNLQNLTYCNDYTIWHLRSMYSSHDANIIVTEHGLAKKNTNLTSYYGVRPVIYVNIEEMPEKSLPCTIHVTRKSDYGYVTFADSTYQMPVITAVPTNTVSVVPTISITPVLSATITTSPTISPTASPTVSLTASPTVSPIVSLAASPTASPTVSPTASPTVSPAASPTVSPTASLTASPTASPTVNPTASPTVNPTATPTVRPTAIPTSTEKPLDKFKLKKGIKFKTSKYVYEITDAKRKYVKLVKPVSKTIKSVKVEAKVKYKGIQFKVVSINSKAFRKCKKLQTVTVGSNVSSIGSYAFDNCSNLRKIKIESKRIKTIGRGAFRTINKHARINIPKSKKNAYKKLLRKSGISKSIKIIS